MSLWETALSGGGGGFLGTLAGLFGMNRLIKRNERALERHIQEDKAEAMSLDIQFDKVVYKDTCIICQQLRDTQHNEVKDNFKDLKTDMKDNFKDFKNDMSEDFKDLVRAVERAAQGGG